VWKNGNGSFTRRIPRRCGRKVRKFLRERNARNARASGSERESLGRSDRREKISAEITALPVEKRAVLQDFLFKYPSSDRGTGPPGGPGTLSFLFNIGLGYLSLDASGRNIGGRRAQRIRLAAQIGLGLTGVLYVLDERASVFIPRDNGKLLDALENSGSQKYGAGGGAR